MSSKEYAEHVEKIASLSSAATSGEIHIVPNHATPGRKKLLIGEQTLWIGTGSAEQSGHDYEYIAAAYALAPILAENVQNLSAAILSERARTAAFADENAELLDQIGIINSENFELNEELLAWQWREELARYDPETEHPCCRAIGVSYEQTIDKTTDRAMRKLQYENALKEFEKMKKCVDRFLSLEGED